MKKNFSIRVSGLVQGVYFRASTKDKADSLNVCGFVRNERDGSVYAEAEGEEEDVKTFIDWCHHGPSHASVERCDVYEGSLKNYSKFTIERS